MSSIRTDPSNFLERAKKASKGEVVSSSSTSTRPPSYPPSTAPLDLQAQRKKEEDSRRKHLRLHRHLKLLLVTRIVRHLLSSQQLDERGLSRSVLSEHDNDLRIGELSGVNVELESSHGLGHRRVRELPRLGSRDVVGGFRDLEREGLGSESQVLGGDDSVEEDVDTWKRKEEEVRSAKARTKEGRELDVELEKETKTDLHERRKAW